jgi:hypothetical protein
MRIFFGVIIGLILAAGIAFMAAKHAFGDFGDIGGRDKSKDVTQTLDLAGFDRIDIGGVFEIDVTVGGDFAVTVSGAPDEMERLDATVENGVLKLDQDEIRIGKKSWRNKGMTAVISLPALNGFDLAGVADGDVTGVDSDEFRVDLAGVGDLTLTGTCGRLDAQVSGVGDLNAKGLECRDVDIDVSGVGSATVYASESVDATVSGIGSIDIYGSPETVEKTNSFIASITVK